MAITLASEEGRKTGYSTPMTYRGPGQMLQYKLQLGEKRQLRLTRHRPLPKATKVVKWQSQD